MSVSLICSCKNRIDALRVSLNSWVAHKEITEIIIVDWSSDEPIDFLLNYDDRIKIIRVPDQTYFNQPQPLNLALSMASGDKILKVDCDYIINPYYNFFEKYLIDENSFVCGNFAKSVSEDKFKHERNIMPDEELIDYVNSYSPLYKYLIGLLYITKDNLLKIGGYNEKLGQYYAYEDDEIFKRLNLFGLTEVRIDYDNTLIHIAHPDKKRTENFYGVGNNEIVADHIRNNLSGQYSGQELEWQVEYAMAIWHVEENKKIIGDITDYYAKPTTQWSITQISERYYSAKIMNDKLKNFPSIYYISLEESVDRRENLHRQFEEYGITNLNGIISKRFSECDDIVTGPKVDVLDDGTKGCVVSHLKMIKKWYEETDEDYAFFCEDDLSIETVKYWDFTWEEFIDKLPEDSECVQLCCIRESQEDIRIRERSMYDWSVTAYILTREYAKKIIDKYCFGKVYNLDIFGTEFYPMPETVIFYDIGKVYAINLFVEDQKFKSTFTETANIESGNKEHHVETYEYVMNWWKQKSPLQKSGTLSHIYNQFEFGEDWFCGEKLYTEMVNKFPSQSTFVEIGSWKGRSAAYMAVEIAKSKKDIKFFCVDPWYDNKGSGEYFETQDNLYESFLNNIEPVKEYITPIRSLSVQASQQFEDESVDFIYVDGAHDYDNVKKDLISWLPKLKIGGIIAGDNYWLVGDFPGSEDLQYDGVRNAVRDVLGKVEKIKGESNGSFFYYVKKENKKKPNNLKIKSKQIILDIEELLTKYSLDTENAENNFYVALWYELNGHNAPALSFFLRCAERTDDDNFAYEALIHASNCYDRQGTRDTTAKGILQQALCLLPNRPEAYFLLSRFSEKRTQWQDCYIYANTGLQYADFDLEPLNTDVEYPGKYGLLFEKALSGWWWGKVKESRDIFLDLKYNYEMEDIYSEVVENNLKHYKTETDSVKPLTDEYVKILRDNEPLTDQYIEILNEPSEIKKSEIGKIDIVLAGHYDESTKDIIESYLKLSFVNKIILSSWESDKEKVDFYDDRIEYVWNEFPTTAGTDNRNLQIITCQNAIGKVSTKYCAKMRTDQKYTDQSMIKMYEYFSDHVNSEGTIFVAGLYPSLLFHPRDHIFWGLKENIEELYDIPLEYNGFSDKVNVSKKDLWKYYNYFVRTETYIGVRYCMKYDESIIKFILDSEKYLHDNSEGWQEAHSVSQKVLTKAFKSFPREGIDLEWKRKELTSYPYDDQKNGYGECWAEDF